MSTAAVSVNLNQSTNYTSYLQSRQSDLQQLGQDLQAGDLTDAQTGPFGGDAFSLSYRQTDFTALGQALQSGDLAGAQSAFTSLADTFRYPPPTSTGGGGGATGTSGSSSAGSTGSTASTSGTSGGSEIVLNLGNAPAGEQITINLGSNSSGGEQV